MDLLLSDELGTRRPAAWVSVAGPLLERDEIKSRRREDLANGISTTRPAGQKDGGATTYLTVRRRDEHSRVHQRCSRAARAQVIQQAMATKREPVDSSIHFRLPAESDFGNTEYKYKCSHPHPIRLQQLITQLGFRLSEGGGEAFYYVGVEDDGYPKGLGPADLEASLATLHVMAASLRAAANLVRCFPGAHGRRCALVHLQKGTQEEAGYLDLRVAVAGCVDSGKSTLVAVLTNGMNGAPTLDSGRGSARVAVLKHKHELESGRTSSVSQHLLGYDAQGRVLNYNGVAGVKEVCGDACKVLTFIDMGGGARCLKSALYGLTALLPDYVLLCCAARAGLSRMSREHLASAVALELPVVVVITKLDTADVEHVATVVAGIRALAAAALPSWSGGSPAAAAADTYATALTGSKGGRKGEREVDMSLVCPVVGGRAHAEQVALQLSKVHAGRCMNSTQASGGPSGSSDVSGAAGSGKLLIPIVPISAVTGSGLDVLHALLRTLQPAVRPITGSPAGGPHASQTARTVGLFTSSANTPMPSDASGAAGSVPPASLLPLIESPQNMLPARGDPAHTHATHPAAGKPPLHPKHPTGAPTAGGTVALPASALELHANAASDVQPEAHFQVGQVFEVEGVGSVVSGTVVSGTIRQGQQLLLGPTQDGSFVLVAVAGIQRAQIPVRQVRTGQAGTLALRPVCDTALGHSDQPWPVSGASDALLQAMQAQQQQQQGPDGMAGRDTGAQGLGVSGVGHVHQPPPYLHHASASVPDMVPPTMSASGSSNLLAPELSTDCATEGLSDDEALACGSSDLTVVDSEDEVGLVQRSRSAAPAYHAPPAPALHHDLGDPRNACPGHGRGSAAAAAASQLTSGEAALLDIMNTTACVQPGAGAGTVDMSPDLLALFDMDDDGEQATGSLAGAGRVASPRASGSRAVGLSDAFGSVLGDSWAEGEAGSLPSGVRHKQRERRQDGPSAHAGGLPVAGVTASAPVPSGLSLAHARMQEAHGDDGPPEAHDSRDQGWGTGHALSSSPPTLPLLSRSPPSGHRGTVLLSLGMEAPRATWTFQCVLVLLGGQWPARGLVSGRWPPVADEELDVGSVTSDAPVRADQPRAAAQPIAVPHVHKAARSKPGASFTAVVHCANIRQLARLEVLQEVPEDLLVGPGSEGTITRNHTHAADTSALSQCLGDLGIPEGIILPGSLRAAAAVLHAPLGPRGLLADGGATGGVAGEDGEVVSRDCGCIALATFRFMKRPCWLTEGARLLLRDRNDGHVSGAGYIRRVLQE